MRYCNQTRFLDELEQISFTCSALIAKNQTKCDYCARYVRKVVANPIWVSPGTGSIGTISTWTISSGTSTTAMPLGTSTTAGSGTLWTTHKIDPPLTVKSGDSVTFTYKIEGV